jgi:protein Mpv17
LFSFAIAGFKGATYQQAVKSAQHDFWGLMNAGWKLWPLISALNFTVVRSVEMRQLLGSLAGFGWNIYLSLSTA